MQRYNWICYGRFNTLKSNRYDCNSSVVAIIHHFKLTWLANPSKQDETRYKPIGLNNENDQKRAEKNGVVKEFTYLVGGFEQQ
ncbi:MAG: hypothetical protein R2828_01915 [Saprospiraceae bacterium]